MATSKAMTHGPNDQSYETWGLLPNWVERLPILAMWLVLICAALFLVAQGIVAVGDAMQSSPYFRGGGVADAMPLSFLATFLTFTWLPAFMPLLLPAVFLVVVIALPFALASRGLRRPMRHE